MAKELFYIQELAIVSIAEDQAFRFSIMNRYNASLADTVFVMYIQG